ncbi:hypothetical protein AVEN_181264-1 [Araneus ventricosus]|uniref:Uncharacterized protein n=1 Tax=Araneus ventricosus TaxID=182803 RepID=A0A4Y2LWS4_ARAVE|nr:hypothetical protein AVEN_3336-1 [Araneus ventricosus]GBN17857.1 hypothetical protein AVEN_114874-1 [Araneus ventricosus]GBN64689.1 hypothetical protein AVEN_126755-1 [Araneus ventricosus]GBN64694.1 hypothetical protein AVEN_181264-1 [Araneus ventricosus]
MSRVTSSGRANVSVSGPRDEWTSRKVDCRRLRVHKFQKGWPQSRGNEFAGDELRTKRPDRELIPCPSAILGHAKN